MCELPAENVASGLLCFAQVGQLHGSCFGLATGRSAAFLAVYSLSRLGTQQKQQIRLETDALHGALES